ncbi:uncharacterized protein BDV14DRAFT_197222 [Aspergillus stella-maris]|uniref:uncharacterized protein n=1 Tax=Aspergillus stella-maris TaxID=1810926 RepID=UPI003CCDB60E
MGRIQACNGPDLSIHLDSAKSFLPGQRITGYVSRTSHWVGTETNISISLHGRCITDFISRDASCHSNLDLFGPSATRSELFNGALHIPRSGPVSNNWPFEVDIPKHPPPSFLKSHPFGKAAYLPLSSTNQHALPPSFDLANSTAGSYHDVAVVEYYLEAIMTTSNGPKHAGPGAIARLPIQLRCEASPFPITDFDVKIHSRQFYTVTSYRLAPGTETVKLSTRQQIASALGISSAPHLTFCLETCIASVLQKGSPYPIPFEIRAVPQWADTSKYIEDVPQTISIINFKLALHSTTSIIAFTLSVVGAGESLRENHIKRKTTLAEYSNSSPKKKTKLLERDDEVRFKDQLGATPSDKRSSSPDCSSPLTLPVDDSSKALDMGQLLDVKLQHNQIQVHDVPTFITYNVKRTYELKWKMALEVGGKVLNVKGRHPVLIMEEAGGD